MLALRKVAVLKFSLPLLVFLTLSGALLYAQRAPVYHGR